MSSGFPGDFNRAAVNNLAGRSMLRNPQGSFRSPLAGILSDSSSLRRPDLIGKRSLAEFQQHQQQQAVVYLRSVKPRPAYNPVDFLTSPEVSSPSSSVTRYGVPVAQQFRPRNAERFDFGKGDLMGNYQKSPENQETEKKMMNRLHELEKELLLDEEDDGQNDAVSVVTNSEWSETFQKSLSREKAVSPSPTTSSSSSSCASTSHPAAAMVSPKQLISEAAAAINDGKEDSAAVENLIMRLNQFSNARGTPEQRLRLYMASALRSRLKAPPPQPSELYKKDHVLSTQLLNDKSPCFKLAFMAANNVILEAGSGQKIHVVDFDIGQGVQYVYLLHEVATAARAVDARNPISLKLTTFSDFGNGGVERLNHLGDGLKGLANKLGVPFCFTVLSLKLRELSRESLMAEDGGVLAVNFGFKLNRLPDESVTTENLRDEVLRRVKGLSPAVVTVVEQDLNANTASFTTRVNETCGYYGALFDSFDSTLPRDHPERVKIEEGLSRRIVNSVACEGRDRVERFEVFGKWRARLSMAGLRPKPLSQHSAELLLRKLNSGTRGKPGFTVKVDSGGVSFGWMGRTLNVVSAWH